MQRVMDLLSLKEHQARTLLIHYRWDVDEVFEVLVEKGKDRLYAEACVMVQYDDNLSSTRRSSLALCEICMEEVPVFKMTTMDCGHWFCNNCWTQHFVVKINEGQSRRISCMAHKCYVVCDEDKIRYYVSKTDPDLAEQFDRYLLESYIEDNKRVKWCPSVPHCGNAIRIEYDEYCEVECACGVQFCFSCSSEAHSPCSCQMWELWTQKCRDESETVNWITVNTKNCPKCHKPVEKNGGCNLVSCICGQPFCWLCGGATGFQHTWESIEGHTCGRFKEEDIANIARAESEIVRYTHYHGRFKAHSDSFKAEVALKEKLQKKISNMEARELEIKNYDWVTDGAERLLRSRRIISYSYPFAYYMFNDTSLSEEMTKEDRNIKQNLFEDHQQQLEGHIEKLSLFLEEPFDEYPEGKVMESRMQIITLSNITDVLCKRIYEYIDNEILLHLRTTINIVPYRSKGADKAVELEL
ncbi:probable E3 ubiquitin-protein ligase ARI2 [Cynara cardunculus var. scolymus]|uniref:probable E3 ubiquitin-protein ligase ARI2 n=1 Tax=Cynara cardunculus var. scolymus TaxID=59895 RepID=UPI000D62BCC9|nr:probable E3 ubiquitin-protein ligase ARI2 [Cynara cardunculus var. scolymus]